MLSLDQVQGFVTVAEELHFGRAAARLNMTQPPLSRQIQRLEADLGVRLLERNARQVRLTAAGATFLEDAQRLLQLAQSAPNTARLVADGWSGSVRLGFTASSALRLLGDLLSQLSLALPNVKIELTELVSVEQVHALANGDIDLGLARPPFDDTRFDSELIRREDLVVALPGEHPLLRVDRPLTGEDLAGQDVIMYSPTKARYFYDMASGVLADHHFQTVHVVSQILTMVQLVAAGHGIALVPQSAKRLGIEGLGFATLLTPVPAPVELHAIWLRESANPSLKRVRAVLRRLGDDAHEASEHPL
ncbi:LysR family transcriptional regulator [Actinospica robiniae]|uniref:LysR family transcriptional regulator n=1 Tax=Actinospica robiniae TaxID=304901 RepID=UPI000412D37A|nr:LysR family transcriptional regulator [Actinospica robiniae]